MFYSILFISIKFCESCLTVWIVEKFSCSQKWTGQWSVVRSKKKILALTLSYKIHCNFSVTYNWLVTCTVNFMSPTLSVFWNGTQEQLWYLSLRLSRYSLYHKTLNFSRHWFWICMVLRNLPIIQVQQKPRILVMP